MIRTSTGRQHRVYGTGAPERPGTGGDVIGQLDREQVEAVILLTQIHRVQGSGKVRGSLLRWLSEPEHPDSSSQT